ncbi:transcriptional regulator [Pontibacillus halophilus JSM 076056 = DSM 19796]|uniref:Transcriptional regulator n=1 Tax=Pontibacillus halophilus JSM 076056 = DSM 19796 TaxID=1385510 RepID=A0A0A5GLZ1_9BACI|nr:MerR family transcriptional regulator [Pontibacillus halophilus]KGX92253.1 transcriptional regulator [Pontibacillus halophilus JSM 076056 = DSM 19796]
MYKVSEFAEMTGLTKETLRYYAHVGLVEPAYIDPSNNYRYYDNHSFLLAKMLVKLRSFGFTIQEMKSVMEDESFENLEALLIKKQERIEEEMKQLGEKRDEIEAFLKEGRGEHVD